MNDTDERIKISYHDKRGAWHLDYADTPEAALGILKRLARRGIPAEAWRGRERVGAVQCSQELGRRSLSWQWWMA